MVTVTSPSEAKRDIDGRIFEATVEPEDLEAVLAAHRVTQAMPVEGRNRVRVFEAEGTPPPEFEQTPPTLEDAYLHHNDYAYWVQSNDDGYITHCAVDSNGTGIYAWDADIKVEEDTLTYNTVGVYLYSSDALIKNFNVLNYNDEAIKCDNFSDAVVESSTVTYNDVGFVAMDGSNPDIGHDNCRGWGFRGCKRRDCDYPRGWNRHAHQWFHCHSGSPDYQYDYSQSE